MKSLYKLIGHHGAFRQSLGLKGRAYKNAPIFAILRRRGYAIALSCPFLLQGLLQALPPAFIPQAQAQAGGAIQMKASRVEANSNTGIVTATGNVRIDYPTRQIYATSAQAQYYSQEQRIVLSGNVDVLQEGNSLQAETVTYLIAEGRFVATPGPNEQVEAVYILPAPPAPAAGANPGGGTGGGTGGGNSAGGAAMPPPVSIPAVPDELPADLGPINSPNSF